MQVCRFTYLFCSKNSGSSNYYSIFSSSSSLSWTSSIVIINTINRFIYEFSELWGQLFILCWNVQPSKTRLARTSRIGICNTIVCPLTGSKKLTQKRVSTFQLQFFSAFCAYLSHIFKKRRTITGLYLTPKINRRLIAYTLSSISAKNYQNWLTVPEWNLRRPLWKTRGPRANYLL